MPWGSVLIEVQHAQGMVVLFFVCFALSYHHRLLYKTSETLEIILAENVTKLKMYSFFNMRFKSKLASRTHEQ